MKLYYYPAACSLAVHAVLNELGIKHEAEMIDIKTGENRKPEYLKLNPRGQVATLVTDDGPITENAAIIIYLDDMHGNKVLPKEGYARAIALQWLIFANSSLHGAYTKYMFLAKNSCPDEKVKEAAYNNIQLQWDEIERQLNDADTDFLAGDTITAADIYTAVVAHWDFIPKKPNFGEKTKALIEKVVSMPSYQKALEHEGVDYNAAA